MFCICIPTINQKDLLVEALRHYVVSCPSCKIIILDNGKQNIPQLSPNIFIFESESNLGVSRSWNFLMKKAIEMGENHILMLNDDIIYTKGQGMINALIFKYGEWTFLEPRPYFNWSIFLISKKIYEHVGEFDPAFVKCFFEDNDYSYRMKLAGIQMRYEDELAPETYRCSETTKKSPELGGYIENREYFVQKWGGLPNEEKYKTPFNK